MVSPLLSTGFRVLRTKKKKRTDTKRFSDLGILLNLVKSSSMFRLLRLPVRSSSDRIFFTLVDPPFTLPDRSLASLGTSGLRFPGPRRLSQDAAHPPLLGRGTEEYDRR